MARCLARESTPEETAKLHDLLRTDAGLNATYAWLEMTIGNLYTDPVRNVDVTNHFNSVSQKLRNEGLL